MWGEFFVIGEFNVWYFNILSGWEYRDCLGNDFENICFSDLLKCN